MRPLISLLLIGLTCSLTSCVAGTASGGSRGGSSLITTEDSYYLGGIVKVDDRLLILLDIERALAQGVDEMPELSEVAA